MSRKRNRTRNVSPKPMTAADEKAQEVRNQIAMDEYSNPAANLGWGAENLTEGTEYPLTRLTQNYMLMLSLYRSSGILRRIINKPVEDAVSHWFKIDSQITPDQIDAIERLERRTRIKANIEKGLKWGYLFGGAAGLIMIDGQGDRLGEPLDINSIEPDSFKGIYVVDRWSGIYPSDELVDDIGSPAFGEPEYYMVRTNERATSNMRVHHSRILRFTGDELPYCEKQVEQYWGSSKIETIWDSLRRYDNGLNNIAQLIWQANIWIHKMDGANNLFGMGAAKMKNNVINSLHAQHSLMDSFGERIVDGADDLQNHPYSFAGLDKVFSMFQYDMSSVSGIPITILFGRSAAGLDATGDADMDNYYTLLEGIQENKMRPVLEQIVPIMCMSEFGAVPDDINVAFNPVRVPDEKEKADIANTRTGAIISAFSAGAISQQIALKELRAMSDSTGMWSNITDEDIKNADDVPDIGDIPSGLSPDALGSAPGEVKPGEGPEEKREPTEQKQSDDSKPSVDEIKEAGRKYTPHYKIVAVRTQDVPFEIGRIKHKSERWSNGEPTGQKLDGLSATSIGSMAIRKHTPEFDPREGQYQGEYVALIGGNRFKNGHDKGEVVIRDPKVLKILRPGGEEQQ